MTTSATADPVAWPVRLALVEDHALVRRGMQELLGGVPGLAVGWAGSDVAGLLSALAADANVADVVLLDIRLNDSTVGPREISQITRYNVRVVIVTSAIDAARARGLLQAGTAAIVLKSQDASDLLDAISQAHAGRGYISPDLAMTMVSPARGPELSMQEQNVLVLYAAGLKINTVARRLGISPHTVKDYLRRIRAKLAESGVAAPTQMDLYRYAVAEGLIE